MAVHERALLRNYWHLVGHRTEVAQDRDYLLFRIFDEDIAVYNDGGNLLAFDNVCPHRGAAFLDEGHGNRPLVCRYHGWSFRGGCLHVPRRESYAPSALEGVTLRTHALERCGDFLFVSPEPLRSLAEQLGAFAEPLEKISRSVAARADFNRYEYECDWKIALENALEPVHVPLIHTHSLGKLKLGKGENTFEGLNSVWRSPVGEEAAAKKLKQIGRLFDVEYRFEGYESFYLFPFTMLSSTFGYSYSLQNFLPTSRGTTAFSSRLLTSRTRAGMEAALKPFFESSAEVNRQVFAEDHEICRRVRRTFLDAPLVYGLEEEKLLHFQRSYREALSVPEAR